MPQDTIYTTHGGDTVYYPAYERLSAEEKEFLRNPGSSTAYDGDYAFRKKEESYSKLALPLTLLLFAGTWLLVKYFSRNPWHLKVDEEPTPDETGPAFASHSPVCNVYNGNELSFSEETIREIFLKRFPFFNSLSPGEQKRFLFRHKKFMRDKTFKIHAAEGYREMPVLVSAAAIQFSFGLEEYMLPFYQYINIYPVEFLRATSSSVCFVEGNVSGNNIKISWKHFLEGYALPFNGENVGLHEMAHAYYCQNFVCGDNADPNFTKAFPAFSACAEKAFEAEKANTIDLYSDYALRNFQEFWAESVEIFFEQPEDMKKLYPDMYSSLSLVLNQSP